MRFAVEWVDFLLVIRLHAMLHAESTLSLQMSDNRLRRLWSHHRQLRVTSKSVWLSAGRQVTARSAQRSRRKSRTAQVRLSLVCLLFSIDLVNQNQSLRSGSQLCELLGQLGHSPFRSQLYHSTYMIMKKDLRLLDPWLYVGDFSVVSLKWIDQASSVCIPLSKKKSSTCYTGFGTKLYRNWFLKIMYQ